MIMGLLLMKHRNCVCLFTRYPVPGTTKTRLIPVLGDDGAATLQQRMTEHAANELRALASSRAVVPTVIYTGGDVEEIEDWLGHALSYRAQHGNDFRDGARNVVIVGSDCPGITADHVERALDELGANDAVAGPVRDGGYWLIGMRRSSFHRAGDVLFSDIPWSTAQVMGATRQAAAAANSALAELTPMQDVDEKGDLDAWNNVVRADDRLSGSVSISVVVPALNEAAHIAETLRSAKRGNSVEVLVVDGGSEDHTRDIAAEAGARVLTSLPGRARQMNEGARQSGGDVLLFLHADTVLPLGYDAHIRRSVVDKAVGAGAFRLRVGKAGIGMRMIERIANARSRYLSLPYGDQAIFVRCDLFDDVRGFPDVPIMEDFVFMRELRHRGHWPLILPSPVRTSGRRWEERGLLRTTIHNQLTVLAYYAGVSPKRLAAWYRRL